MAENGELGLSPTRGQSGHRNNLSEVILLFKSLLLRKLLGHRRPTLPSWMAGGDSDVAVRRLKREDCQRTKHDSAFSTWKVLVGPTDWEDYSLGKEGATRYRVHNLPTSPGPGIYELGVATSRARSGREIAKLDSHLVVGVYLGQADCVRTRLQQYGRSGAHLGRCSPAACETDRKTSFPTGKLGLFEGVLSRGNPIVFRWAPLNDKEDARRAELLLLERFDYAWNKGSNGSRRPCDIFRKLDEIASSTYHISRMAMKLLPFRPRQVGIGIKGKLLSENKESFPQTGGESSNFSNGIFKFSKSRPRLVISESRDNETAISGTSRANESFSPLCGVILEDGFPCTKPPVQGRKRCSRHKGMRIWPSNSASYADDTAISGSYPANESFSPLCGVILEDGSPCTKPPVQGRERCSEHKGMRIRPSNSVPRIKGASSEIHGPGNMLESFSQQGNIKNDFGAVCGVDFGDGTFCMRRAAQGRVRCELHKGMRIPTSNSVPRRTGASSEIHGPGDMLESFSQQGNVKSDFGAACGVDFGDGTFCTRRAAQGRVRCEHHKGMRIRASNAVPRREGASSEIHGPGNVLAFSRRQGSVKNDFGAVCGVRFGDGTFCTRRAAPGRVRCEHHKGMRVN